jgi:hypothetical protein
LFFIGGVHANDPIGDIVESTGVGELLRGTESFPHSVGSDVILYDEARTGNGRMKIVLLDNEFIDMTEQTRVYIDEAYYDPNPDLSKMSIRMVQGTARFASGTGQKIRKKNINVSTPTAQIAINGTDFTTSIDEIGRSLVILLPDANGDASGEIVVSNLGGEVTLNEAYQATMVSSLDSPPTSSVVINGITPALIDNMFIVNPPQEIKQAIEDQVADDQDQDQGILDVDFLEFNELEQDALEDTKEDLEFSELDIDLLNVDFLTDLLDVVEELTRTTVTLKDVQADSGGGTVTLKGAVFGFNKDSQYNIFVQDGDLYFYRNVNGVIEIIIQNGNSGFIDSYVEGYQGVIEFGNGDPAIEIFINQTN